MMSTDDHALNYVDAYLHGALDSSLAFRVERHCEECPTCRVAMAEARARFATLKAIPGMEASQELIQKTEARIAQQGRAWPSPVSVLWSLVAAAAIVIACFHVYFENLSPSPYDLRLLGQRELFSGSDASVRVVLLSRPSEQPLVGVPVDIELANKGRDHTIRLASFTTDRFGSGAPQLRLPEWEDGEYNLSVRARFARDEEIVLRTIKLHRKWQVMLSSDKPVYQPGQVIHLRSLALRKPDLKPIAGQAIEFSIVDPKGNRIFQQKSVTSRFGISSTDCPLADEIIQGTYQLQCTVGGTSTTAAVEVKQYVLPKFKVDLEFDRPYYSPGERVVASVRAAYFFGQPVRGADIEAHLESTGPLHVIDKAQTHTDEQGHASIEFGLPTALVGRPQDSAAARILLTVKLRDSAGQEHSSSASRIVTDQPIHLRVIPESGTLKRNLANSVYVFTSYPDGSPARTHIAVSGMDRELASNELGLAVLEIRPTTEQVNWTMRATDNQGRVGQREITLKCGANSEDFLVRLDKVIYRGGDTMHLVALGGGREPVYIDLIKDGQTVATDAIPVNDGRGEYQFDLPPELFGTVELCAYRYSAQGWPVTNSRTIYIHQARALNLTASFDREEYRPGGRARLSLSVADDTGKPVPGAVSLAVVDEAIFQVGQQRPGLEQSFFSQEERLLAPVYAIYPWSPAMTIDRPSQDRQQFEQALFAATAGRRAESDARRRIVENPEGGARLLEALERPDWKEIAERMGLSRDVITALDGTGSPHSLSVSSYAAKVPQIEAAKRLGLEKTHFAWNSLGVVIVIGFLVWLARHGLAALVAVFVILVMLASLLLPAIQSAREASRRSTAANDLRMMDLILQEQPRRPAAVATVVEPPRLRQWFPETLLWRPELITDDQGRAEIEFDIADSITAWRLSASAVSAQGKLGAAQHLIRVFQSFFVDVNIPTTLTRGDEVTIPVVVYNYLDEPQTVTLRLADVDAFERLDGATQQVELKAREVKSVGYRLRAKNVGHHAIEIEAQGHGVADAIKRQVDVIPNGRAVEQVVNGVLDKPTTIEVTLPADAIPGSAKMIVRLYPSTFSQLVEGLDAIFQRPYGCFEQTSSTTYPNVLALEYLKRTGKSMPGVETKAREYIHLGYQRLLSFEIADGGFDWFGHPPANRTLSAYGLMEFEDMARVHNIDRDVVERTRHWLLGQRKPDGSWDPESHKLHEDPTRGAGRLGRLATTAYIALAVFTAEPSRPQAQPTLEYLRQTRPSEIDDPYVLALVCNALTVLDPQRTTVRSYVERLDALKQSSADGKLVWWGPSLDRRTIFCGAGLSGQIETTALASLALIATSERPETSRAALAWLIQQKDPQGTWHSTQATVLALKALLAGTGKSIGDASERLIELSWDGQPVRKVTIPADQAEVMQQIDLTDFLTSGSHRLQLTDRSGRATGFQVTSRHHLPDDVSHPQNAPLTIELTYDRLDLKIDDTVDVTAVVANQQSVAAPMVMVDLPIPAGFAMEPKELDLLVLHQTIAKYQITPRSTIVYLRNVAPSDPLTLRYRLRAIMPVKALAAPAVVYEYYDPDRQASSATTPLTVTAK